MPSAGRPARASRGTRRHDKHARPGLARNQRLPSSSSKPAGGQERCQDWARRSIPRHLRCRWP
eukprot:3282034-Pyramimonas_sp.AAC.1